MSVKVVALPAAIILLLALYPQITFWINGGSSSPYFVSNYDEPAYSAYIEGLIEGKARKSDPFTQTEPEFESLYSIQFVPAYLIAIPARVLGLSASTTFIFLIAICSLLAYLALFWLLREVTGNEGIAAAGGLAVLCLGTAAAFQGELRHLLTGSVLVDFFPFMRRYQPGVAFPIFFVFCLAVWKAMFGETKQTRVIFALAGGWLLVLLIFSYFFLWTAAVGWLVIFGLASLIFGDGRRGTKAMSLAIIITPAIGAFGFYVPMLANRAPNIDSVQLLDLTHGPNLASPVMWLGIAVVVAFGFAAFRGKVATTDPRLLLGISFAAMPLILLNQQVLTGRSLQPVHYEIFIANYLVVAAAIILASILWRAGERKTRAVMYIILGCAVWGLVEAAGSTSRASASAGLRDRSIPAISEIASRPGANGTVVLSTHTVISDIIPTIAPLRPLWNAHSSSAGSIDAAENKRLFFLFLYFSGFTSADLANELKASGFEATAAVFGSDRALPTLASGSKNISAADIQAEVQNFERFVTGLDRSSATSPTISYAIVPKTDFNFANLDRWYTRDAGKEIGLFKVFALTPKS